MTEVLDPVRIEEPEKRLRKAVFVLYGLDGDPVSDPIPVPHICDGVVLSFLVTRGTILNQIPTGFVKLFIDDKPSWIGHLRRRQSVCRHDMVHVTLHHPVRLLAALES